MTCLSLYPNFNIEKWKAFLPPFEDNEALPEAVYRASAVEQSQPPTLAGCHHGLSPAEFSIVPGSEIRTLSFPGHGDKAHVLKFGSSLKTFVQQCMVQCMAHLENLSRTFMAAIGFKLKREIVVQCLRNRSQSMSQ